MFPEKHHHNTFLIVPAYVANNPKIDDSTAMLFGRLNALSNQKGYCFASDEYLAELSKVSEGEIQKRLKTLEKEGVIKRFTNKKGMKWERKIYTCNNYSQIKITNTPDGAFETIHTDSSKQSIRTTYINKNTNSIKETLSKERVKKDAVASPLSPKKEVSKEGSQSFLFFEKFVNVIIMACKELGIKKPKIDFSPKNLSYCEELLSEYGEEEMNEVLEHAIKDRFWSQVIANPHSFFKNYSKIKLNMLNSKKDNNKPEVPEHVKRLNGKSHMPDWLKENTC